MRNYSAGSSDSAFAVIKVSTSKALWLFERLRSIGRRLCPQEPFLFNISIHCRKIGTFLHENLFFTQERKNSADRSRLPYTQNFSLEMKMSFIQNFEPEINQQSGNKRLEDNYQNLASSGNVIRVCVDLVIP